MSTDNTEIKDWQDDLAEKDIISTAWQAEFFGPEEKIEDEQELAKFDVHVIYKNTKNFTWYYPQIKAALLADSVKEFVEYHGIVDATDNDIEELKAFFFHYVRFINFEVDLDETAPQVFEATDVNETIGDDDMEEIVDELKEAKMDRFGDKPTLH